LDNPFQNEDYVSEVKYFLTDQIKIKDQTTNSNFSNFITLIKKNEWKKAYLYSNSNYFDNEEKKLCLGIYYFFKNDFLKANEYFKEIDRNKYSCAIKLILCDCEYELAKIHNIKNQTFADKILQSYQEVFDCSPIESFRILVKNRIKIIKYEI
jgi:hypothetical protein